MKDLEIVVLDNGLKVYLLNDPTKHTTYMNLIVNYGGIDNTFYINNKKYVMRDGLTHFIEHLVLESSIYGDLMENFGKMGIISNGLTSINRTQFYIDTVDHVYDGLKVLIKGIHSPVINNEIIENIRKPILEEKRKSLDNKYSLLYHTCLNSIIDNKKYKSILGELKDIKSINETKIKLAFNAMYRPNNEIIVIGGRFDRDLILKTIKDSYNSLEFNNDLIIKEKTLHKSTVNRKKTIIKTNSGINRGVITVKLDTLNLSGLDKLNLDMFLAFFLKMNFGITSKLNKELLNKRIINGGIVYSNFVVEGYHYIRIESDTNNVKVFINKIIEYLICKKFEYNNELFELFKKNTIINLITRNDSIYDIVDPFIDNLVSFDYEGIDKISDVEDTTFDDFVSSIKTLDFKNYSISILKDN